LGIEGKGKVFFEPKNAEKQGIFDFIAFRGSSKNEKITDFQFFGTFEVRILFFIFSHIVIPFPSHSDPYGKGKPMAWDIAKFGLNLIFSRFQSRISNKENGYKKCMNSCWNSCCFFVECKYHHRCKGRTFCG